MLNIIPQPNKIEINKSKIKFSNYELLIERKYEKAVIDFNEKLEKSLEIDDNALPYPFEFRLNRNIKIEGYNLLIDEDRTVIEAANEVGFYYATRTLIQIFNLYTNKKNKKITAPTLYIEDSPRVNYRSFMLDESRHFFGKDEVMKLLDVMSDLKINHFHWHLSDDQGFRINFKTFPRLKEIASKRNNTKIDNDNFDNIIYDHCYDYHEIKEIIAYAKNKYIDIVPEIDIPGHTSAIVAAYKELHCQNKQCEVRGDFGVFNDIICLGKDYSYVFVKKLLDEVCLLFNESLYIHIGGDEVGHKNHDICQDCQRKMHELGFDNMDQLQAYFSNQMAEHIMKTTNKEVIMWHDGVHDNTNKDVIMQYWDYRMLEDKIEYINKGKTTIYSPCSQFYFNDPYGELPLKTTYERGINLDGLTAKGYKNIIGMECCLWTEWVSDTTILEFNIFPRLLAFAEVSWTSNLNLDFDNFVNKIENINDFYNYYHLVKAPASIYLVKAKDGKEISTLYRGNDKLIELELANIK